MMNMAFALKEKTQRSIWDLHAFIVKPEKHPKKSLKEVWVLKIESMQTNIQSMKQLPENRNHKLTGPGSLVWKGHVTNIEKTPEQESSKHDAIQKHTGFVKCPQCQLLRKIDLDIIYKMPKYKTLPYIVTRNSLVTENFDEGNSKLMHGFSSNKFHSALGKK